MMNSKERVSLLLQKQIPDRMGLFDHFWGETLREENWIAQGYPKGVSPEEYFDFDIAFCGGWFDSSIVPGRSEIVEDSLEWKILRDGRGALLKYWKNRSGTPEHIGFEVTSADVWKRYRDGLLTVNRQRLGDLEEVRANVANARQRGKFVVYNNPFVFELLRGTLGDVNFLPALLEDPKWIHDFCRVYLDHYKMHYEVFFREVGLPDGIWIYEDFGFRNGLFCSPATMAEMIMPYEKELVSFFHDHNLPVILHSCGDIRKAIPLIIDAGFDCLQPMEAKAGCDVVQIAKTYGNKLAYMGNIDVMKLETNDPAKVREEVVSKVSELKKMRISYLFHSHHSIPPSIQFRTYQYALAVFQENCRYGFEQG
jgi:uroporphyrinogen decarboxylase